MNATDFFAKYDNTYLEQYDEMFMLMYVYLHRHRSVEGYINLTVKDFLLYYNYSPNRGKGRINNKVSNILDLMENNGFIKHITNYSNNIATPMGNIDCAKMFTVQIINFDENWNPENNFTKISYDEIDNLRKNNVQFMGKALNIYINIKKYISFDTKNPSAVPFTYVSESSLSKKCNYGVNTIKKYIKILCDIKMLYLKNYGSYRRMLKGKEIIENSNNVYALKKEDLDDKAKESLRKYLKTNYGFIDGFYPFCNNLTNDITK